MEQFGERFDNLFAPREEPLALARIEEQVAANVDPGKPVGALPALRQVSLQGLVGRQLKPRIKKIASAAREEIEALLERKVYLRLWVKAVPGWTRDPVKARRFATLESEE